MDHGSGSKRFSSTKNSWRARLFKSQRCRFLGLSVSPRMKTHLFAGSCVLRESTESLLGSAWGPLQPLRPKVSSTFLKVQNLMSGCRNWWLFHQISKLNKLAVMALICPCSYFFMAHQCRTWCPSSICEGRGFSFLPPRETTIRVQQTPEVPGSTADEVLSISVPVFLRIYDLTLNQTQEWSPTMLHTIPTWDVKKQTTQRKKTMPVGNLSCLHFASHVFSCRLDFCADSTEEPDSALMSLMSESMRKPAKPFGSLRS